jgi:DNA polymerase III subunit delta'
MHWLNVVGCHILDGMAWNSILGHEREVEKLRHGCAAGRLAHAYAFVGTPGIGKYRFARQFAQCLLCDNHPDEDFEACGTCASCRQVAADTHPDLLVVQLPDGKRELPLALFIGDKENRGKDGLCYDINRKPMSARRRVAIINDADAMNEEGANALLKTLEEPPPHSIIVLIAASADQLLSTIRSRCQIVTFQPLSPPQVREILLREGLTTDAGDAERVASLAEGSLVTARQLLDPRLRAVQTKLYDLLAEVPFRSAQTAEQMIDHAESSGSDKSAHREGALWIIRFCLEFYRHALLIVAGSPTVSPQSLPQAAKFAQRLTGPVADEVDRLTDLLERTLTAEDHIDRNAGVPLCLEALFDDLGRILRRP